MGLTAVSLFAGIGGIDLALERSGFKLTAAVEIDKAARGVLADQFPKTTLFEDVTKVTADDIRRTGFVPSRGLVAAGFPCQDLSVAGGRRGLGEGTRSGLYWHIVRLLADLQPRWVLLENVPGLLSATCPCPGDGSCGTGCPLDGEAHPVTGGVCEGGCIATHGGAMGAVLGSLGELGYGFAYRVLDAQHFGVPQRRRRVFIVGCLGDPASAAEVLLEPEGGGRNPAAVPTARTDVADAAAQGTSSPGVVGAVSTLQGGGRCGYRIERRSSREARYQWNRLRGIPACVPPHGTQRRLLALAALGWTWRALAPYMGVDERVVYQFAREPRDYMHASTAEKVARVYDQLSMTRPEGPMAERMRRRAARRGWAPPLAWDDDTIDDPRAEPRGQRTARDDLELDTEDWVRRILAGQRPPGRTVPPHSRAAIVAMWPETGLSYAELARRTGWKPERYAVAEEAAS